MKGVEWFKKYLEYNKSTTQEHSSNIILAWTNKQCNIYNDTVRNIIFKDKQIINKYEIGDILILNDFYIMDETKSYKKDNVKEKDNRLYTSEQIKITDLEIIIKKSNSFSIILPKQLHELKNIGKIETKFKQYVNKINNFNTSWDNSPMYDRVFNGNYSSSLSYIINKKYHKKI